MSLLGFVITGFIFLSVFDAKITESICGCRSHDLVKVCKGDSTVLKYKPSAGISITGKINVKLIRTARCQGKIKGNSPRIKLNNIGENDTGIYRFRGRGFGSAENIYCINLTITNCEHLVVPSGSSVNLTCKVKNIKKIKEWRKNGPLANSTSRRTLTLSQLKKSHSGNYTCLASQKDTSLGATRWKHYTFVLKVYEPQLVATTKETSQEKHTSRFSTVVSVPTSMTRKETTPGFTTNRDTTKAEVTESVPNFTQLKTTRETLDTTKNIEETVPSTKEETVPFTEEDSAAVYKVRGEKGKRPNSIGTRVNCAFSVLVLSQLYIWIWKIYTTNK